MVMRYEIDEAERRAVELISHRGEFVPYLHEALESIRREGATEWRSRYHLARALKRYCKVRAHKVRHARALLALCVLRGHEGWPDANPLPRGGRGRVSNVLMEVWGASEVLGHDFHQFAWDVTDDSMRSPTEIEGIAEELAQVVAEYERG